MSATAQDKSDEVDFSYTTDGLFVRLFPNNAQAEDAWRLIAAKFESGVVPSQLFGAVRGQLKAAGYRVRKQRPQPMSSRELDTLCAELGL